MSQSRRRGARLRDSGHPPPTGAGRPVIIGRKQAPAATLPRRQPLRCCAGSVALRLAPGRSRDSDDSSRRRPRHIRSARTPSRASFQGSFQGSFQAFRAPLGALQGPGAPQRPRRTSSRGVSEPLTALRGRMHERCGSERARRSRGRVHGAIGAGPAGQAPSPGLPGGKPVGASAKPVWPSATPVGGSAARCGPVRRRCGPA